MRDQLGNAKRGAPRGGRCQVRNIDLRTSSGHSSIVAGQYKILQGGGYVVAEGDDAKLVEVCVMAVGPDLIGVGETHDMLAISISKLSGACVLKSA